MLSNYSERLLVKLVLVLVIVFGLGALIGCSNNENPKSQDAAKSTDVPKPTELKPVTLKIHMALAYGDDAFFQEIFVAPVKARYPHITLERVLPLSGETAEKLAAAGDIPDLLVEGVGLLAQRNKLGLAIDLTALAKKHNSDLTRFRPTVLDAHRSLDGKELLGIPWNGNFNALYYNKDIFDKFAVPYPKDGMVWNDVIELTRKLSRTADGVKYYGYDVDSLHRITFPLSLTAIDIRTNKASVNTDDWRKALKLGMDLYSVPGNDPLVYSGGTARFTNAKNTAMLGTINLLYRLLGDEGKGLNWDVVQYPSYPERLNTFGRVDVHSLQISETSKHKDDAFMVADLIGSSEIQTKLVRKHARYTPLADSGNKIMSQFADDIPELKSKNVKALFKSTYAPFKINHEFESRAFTLAGNKFSELMKGKDLNTGIRELEEEINKLLLGN